MSNENIEYTSQVIEYIESCLEEPLSLETVADVVHCSKYHLHRIFTETAGLTIHEYIRRRRLTEAARQLVYSDRPLYEIAILAGYGSRQAFSDIFKAMYKLTPSQFREKKTFYPLQLRYTLIHAPEKEKDWENRIAFAEPEDIPAWMELVRLVAGGFPYLDEAGYQKQLTQYIREKRALILKDQETAAGIMGFHAENGSIDFLGIHPQYAGYGIEQAFIQKAAKEMRPDQSISITTFRKGDKADPGYRAVYQALGFTEAEMLVEYGYPTQRFVMRRH